MIERAKCACILIDKNNKKLECKCFSAENQFILGQFYFDRNNFQNAFEIFNAIKTKHMPSLFQAAIILYDDLLDEVFLILIF